MSFLARMFGVTFSDADRNLAREAADIEEITQKSLLMQARAATAQHRPLARGTHAKGVCARAEFEVLDVTQGREPALAARLAQGIYAKPGVYPAVVRFGNSDSKKLSDFKPDVRSMSFSVDLARGGMVVPNADFARQDFSMQNTKTLPINDSPAFRAIVTLLTASNPAAVLWRMSFKDRLRVIRTLTIVQGQLHQKIRPYQQLRYGSNVPFRYGPADVVKHSATPSRDNPAMPLQKSNPNGLQDELIRHIQEDERMSSFDFGIQFLAPDKMTYRGKNRDASFWIENASVEWKESEAAFHTVAKLTLVNGSHLGPEETKATYFDVTHHSSSDSTPVGSINRARAFAEAASRKARMAAVQQA